MMVILFLALLVSSCFISTNADAVFMIQNYCSRALSVGTTIMGAQCAASTSKSIVVQRGATTLNSGDTYVAGETLQISLGSSSGNDYVLQTSSGSFSGGGCTSGTRLANQAGSLVMPGGGSAVTITAGWASRKGAVLINTFTLTAPVIASSIKPTVTPSIAPSLAPTIVPTKAPTIIPTKAPTFVPTKAAPTISSYPTMKPTTASPTLYTAPTLVPTLMPTLVPSLMPTLVPTLMPTLEPTVAPTLNSGGTSGSTDTTNVASNSLLSYGNDGKVATGLIIGQLGLLLLFLLAYRYAQHVQAGIIDPEIVKTLVVKGTALIACILATITLGLVFGWAQEPTETDYNYIGKLYGWSNIEAIFPWHAVFMVGGFMVSQIFAIAVWSLGKVHYHAKLTHVFFQTFALMTMILGLIAILEDQKYKKAPTFTTIHSIVGIMAVAVFGLNYLWGSAMALLTVFHPGSIFRKVFDLRWHHRKIGGAALILCWAATLTGVMNQLSYGSCFYQVTDGSSPSFDADATTEYPHIPTSCKIAYGMAISLSIAVLCVISVALDRGDNFHMTVTSSSSSPATTVVKTSEESSTARPTERSLTARPSEREYSNDFHSVQSIDINDDDNHHHYQQYSAPPITLVSEKELRQRSSSMSYYGNNNTMNKGVNPLSRISRSPSKPATLTKTSEPPVNVHVHVDRSMSHRSSSHIMSEKRDV